MRPTPRAFRPILVRALVVMALLAGSAAGAPLGSVESVTVEDGTAGLGVVRVALNAPPTYSARLDVATRRLIVDLAGVRIGDFDPAWTEAHGVVGGVLTQTFDGTGTPVTRVTIALTREASYAFVVEENRLLVQFSEGPLGAVSTRPEAPEAQAVVTKAETDAARQAASDPTAGLMDVDFSHTPYRDVVELELDTRAHFRLDNGTSGRSTLIIRDASVPEALVRTLDVGAFGGLVQTISSFGEGHDVVVQVQREAAATSSVERHGNKLLWSFYRPGALPSSLTGVARDGKEARRSKTVTTEETKDDLPTVRTAEEVMATGATTTSEQVSAFGPTALGQADNYAGRRIDLDLKDAVDPHSGTPG